MGLRIKALRKAAGLSQQALADMAGVSRSQLSEIETEAAAVNTRRLNAIANALGVGIEDLFEKTAQDDFMTELQSILKDVGEDDRAAILQLARSLVQR